MLKQDSWLHDTENGTQLRPIVDWHNWAYIHPIRSWYFWLTGPNWTTNEWQQIKSVYACHVATNNFWRESCGASSKNDTNKFWLVSAPLFEKKTCYLHILLCAVHYCRMPHRNYMHNIVEQRWCLLNETKISSVNEWNKIETIIGYKKWPICCTIQISPPDQNL